ncbi:DNA topoisomerase II [Schizosaccharomyces cryophilus OY26]|uniref:DNA topoisomerase 2 n=1 Tax=Schizosaccharomyces cryophilus (strain OY26 / ATCC MYA-4695 / CBS 11777 / NBRC 106824 / NRRL Y48691) TaxID=653667 RepID=S9XAC9_SCHCR|nr:DNA topoisomerase II [Schizosaccharomyces cryophilus OY26]EPY54117.1 DNA topoisomerase II [Schizosaccharomyces cryophilus OY26]
MPSDDEFVLSNSEDEVVPTTTRKRATSSQSRTNEGAENDRSASPSSSSSSVPATADGGGTTVRSNASSQYQRLSPREHVLRRPDTYVGSIDRTTSNMWVYDSENEKLEYREVTYVPGLYKIFDEIIVNAADNKVRDPTMNTLKVTIDPGSNVISVFNNGKGIPVEIHDKEQIYIPELIFGNLLTSSNYDDNQRKVTGGRNGYGAKLCNIFSSEFTVETADKFQMKKYKQVWTDNMSKKQEPIVTNMKRPEEYTKITFKPDLQKFGMTEIDADIVAILKRRVYDMAGTVRDTKVFLNDERLKISGFKKYVDMYLSSSTSPDSESPTVVYEQVNDRWEVAFAISDEEFNQVSFVNNIATIRGGTHVNYIADTIVKAVNEDVQKKNKGAPIRPFQIKNFIRIFVSCQIENPSFDSQTKETLTTKVSNFGSQCTPSASFMTRVKKSGIIDKVLDLARTKADKQLSQTDSRGSRSRITGLPKLEDANKAGSKESHKCVLILTEGDSARSQALSGLSVVGRDYYGIFPLRGKLLNVREASHTQIMNNKEIQAIKKIMGLVHKKNYTDAKELRYGHLMIMTDQDPDGSHIKGLIINYLESTYPSLLKIPGFLIQFITPIVKCKRNRQELPFYTLPEYEYWKEANNNGRGWDIKYYKGLGTNDATEMKSYFSDLDRHMKYFHEIQDKDKGLIEMAFAKKKADMRKEWLRSYHPGIFMDYTVPRIPIDDFINKELIQFSMADNIRSIPSVVDGLKPGQRKVVYYCLKKNVTRQTKVSSLTGYVMSETAYHHGDNSLTQTIVNLAQNFVGSNNINLLMPHGQFGTRLEGGKDASAPRYLNTCLSPLARKLFKSEDDPLLNYQNEEGQWIEPDYYVPILPLVLINGAEGIGTGWSTNIPNYNPKDIAANLRRLLNNEPLLEISPWYRGFRGSIEKVTPDRYKVSGIINQISESKVEITELPVRFWTQDMKEFLEMGIAGSEKVKPFIKDYEGYHGVGNVHFQVTLTESGMREAQAESLESKFKIVRSQATSNMMAFDPSGRIKKYETVEEILRDFYEIRLRTYQRRKELLVADLERRFDIFSNQARFVHMIIENELVVSKKKRSVLVTELREKGFQPISKPNKGREADMEAERARENGEDSPEALEDSSSDFNYLLSMAIWSLTYEKYLELLKKRDNVMAELDALIKLTPKDLYLQDLEEFEFTWDKVMEEINQSMLDDEESSNGFVGSTKPSTTRRRNTGVRKKVKAEETGDNGIESLSTRHPSKSTTAKSTKVKNEEKDEPVSKTLKGNQQTLSFAKESGSSSNKLSPEDEGIKTPFSIAKGRSKKAGSSSLSSETDDNTNKGKKRSSSDSPSDDENSQTVKRTASRRGRPKATQTKTLFSSDDEEDLPSETIPGKSQTKLKSPFVDITNAKGNASKGKTTSIIDDEDFDDLPDSSTPKPKKTDTNEKVSASESPSRPRRTATRRAASTKNPIYIDSSMDESSFKDDSFMIGDNEDDDYEDDV